MTASRCRSWTTIGLSLVVCFGVASPEVLAQTGTVSTTAPTAEQLRSKAADFEKAGKWEEALQVWVRLYGQDRQNDEAHKHIQVCLRRMFQAQRTADKSLREKVLSLSHSQALALYGEVLTTLHASYVDRARATPARLFQQGLDEFLVSINDEKFRQQHMPGIKDAAVRMFQNRLRDYLALRAVDTVADAAELVKQVAAAAKRDLHIAKTSVVVLEFIAGACNSLDEYTAYLSPAELAAEVGTGSESSVDNIAPVAPGVGFFRITHFTETTAVEVENAIATLRMHPQLMNMRALVMDLRGNHGGQFLAAVQVASRFVNNGVLATTQGQLDEFNRVHTGGMVMNVIDLPLVVLVDGSTASAAEALAAALRDHQRATLVGTPTFGKGSIQRVLQFATAEETDENGKPRSRSGGIRITLGRFFSPNGQAVSGAGITPNVVETDKARQLPVAIEQASRYVSDMTPGTSPTETPIIR